MKKCCNRLRLRLRLRSKLPTPADSDSDSDSDSAALPVTIRGPSDSQSHHQTLLNKYQGTLTIRGPRNCHGPSDNQGPL